MKKNFDVIISGAGPSGSLLGYLLSKNNVSTLILEKEVFPRHKVCAGGIQWKALKLLPYDLSEIAGQKICGIYFSRKLKDIFYREYPEPLMHTFERAELDSLMAKKALECGCSINFSEKIRNFETGNDGVSVFTDKNTYFSKVIIGADGAGSIISRKLNKGKNILKIIGYEMEVPVTDDNSYPGCGESIVLDFGGFKKGYLWIFPKASVFSIGAGGPAGDALNIKKYLEWFLEKYPGALKNNFSIETHKQFNQSIVQVNNEKRENRNLSHRPGMATDIKDIKNKLNAHFIPVRSDKTFLCDYRVLTVGDAAGLGDGFTGEGLHNAFLSSIIAAESIQNAFSACNFNFIDYHDRISRDIYSNIRYSLIISKIFFSSPYFYYKLIKNNDNLFNACARILRGEKNYSDVVNKLKLIKI